MLVGLDRISDSLCVAQGEKSMSVQLRIAKPEDAGAIAGIAELAEVASIDADSPRVRKRLGGGRTFVATRHGEVIGFVDSFVTADPTGGRRFELDLLAVAPAAQGCGVGGSLLAASLAVAAEGGAQHIRALVRCENAAMQKLCRRHGFVRSTNCFELYVVDPQPVPRRKQNHDARVIAVETLNYAGLWLEGELSQAAIDDAHWLASQGELAVIGAVIPSTALDVVELLEANSFRKVSQYHWWTINLRND